MAFVKRWNADQTLIQLRQCAAEMNDWRNDGYSQWSCKQDLYRVKFELDRLLATSPHFSMEEEWLEEQQKQQVWDILNDKNV
jgi:hypothetical protein